MKHSALLLVAAVAVGCGDNEPLCDYHEASDLTNDRTAEATGLATGGAPIGLCGSIDNGHFEPAISTVDVDAFQVAVGGSGDLAVELVGGDGVELLADFSVSIFTDDPNPTLVAAGRFNTTLADHGAFDTQLTPGNYRVVVTALARGDLSGAIGYRVALVPDPVARCPAATHVDYTESLDGDDSTGNDVVEVDFTKTPPFTSVAGTPEPTRLSIDDLASYRISGDSLETLATQVHTDEYLDRDTYAIVTGARTNELTLRVDWSDTAADLDFVVFEAATLAPLVVSNVTSDTGPELAVVAVKPATKYFVWVGSFMGSSGATPYDITICGAHFIQ